MFFEIKSRILTKNHALSVTMEVLEKFNWKLPLKIMTFQRKYFLGKFMLMKLVMQYIKLLCCKTNYKQFERWYNIFSHSSHMPFKKKYNTWTTGNMIYKLNSNNIWTQGWFYSLFTKRNASTEDMGNELCAFINGN